MDWPYGLLAVANPCNGCLVQEHLLQIARLRRSVVTIVRGQAIVGKSLLVLLGDFTPACRIEASTLVRDLHPPLGGMPLKIFCNTDVIRRKGWWGRSPPPPPFKGAKKRGLSTRSKLYCRFVFVDSASGNLFGTCATRQSARQEVC